MVQLISWHSSCPTAHVLECISGVTLLIVTSFTPEMKGVYNFFSHLPEMQPRICQQLFQFNGHMSIYVMVFDRNLAIVTISTAQLCRNVGTVRCTCFAYTLANIDCNVDLERNGLLEVEAVL